MAVDAGFPARLASLIQEERRGLQGFIALLKREEALLIATQIDALSALAEEKTGLYRSLQRLSDERVVMFARLGAKVTDENIRIVLAHAPDALTAWDEVVALAGEANAQPFDRPPAQFAPGVDITVRLLTTASDDFGLDIEVKGLPT